MDIEKAILRAAIPAGVALVAALLIPPAAFCGGNMPSVTPGIPRKVLVTMGDSFEAGVYIIPNLAGCARQSIQAAQIIAGRLGMTSRNVSCVGATTEDIIRGFGGEPSQLKALDQPNVGLVVISAGGNNVVRDSKIVDGCVLVRQCNVGSKEYIIADRQADALWDNASKSGTLAKLYGEVRKRTSAKVLVHGYPQYIKPRTPAKICADTGKPRTGVAGGDKYGRVSAALEAPGCDRIDNAERELINKLVLKINGAIRQASAHYGFTYVDPFEPGWYNHDTEHMCSLSHTKLVQALWLPIPFHPTFAGVQSRANHVISIMSK